MIPEAEWYNFKGKEMETERLGGLLKTCKLAEGECISSPSGLGCSLSTTQASSVCEVSVSTWGSLLSANSHSVGLRWA